MTTAADRRKELGLLLEQMRAYPSRDWTAERERAVVLSRMLAADQPASTTAH